MRTGSSDHGSSSSTPSRRPSTLTSRSNSRSARSRARRGRGTSFGLVEVEPPPRPAPRSTFLHARGRIVVHFVQQSVVQSTPPPSNPETPILSLCHKRAGKPRNSTTAFPPRQRPAIWQRMPTAATLAAPPPATNPPGNRVENVPQTTIRSPPEKPHRRRRPRTPGTIHFIARRGSSSIFQANRRVSGRKNGRTSATWVNLD